MSTEKIVKGVVGWHVNIMSACNVMGALLVRVYLVTWAFRWQPLIAENVVVVMLWGCVWKMNMGKIMSGLSVIPAGGIKWFSLDPPGKCLVSTAVRLRKLYTKCSHLISHHIIQHYSPSYSHCHQINCEEIKVLKLAMYVGGSISFRPDIQRPRQMQNALRDI